MKKIINSLKSKIEVFMEKNCSVPPKSLLDNLRLHFNGILFMFALAIFLTAPLKSLSQIREVVEYEYNSSGLLWQKIERRGDGIVRTTEYAYAYEITNDGTGKNYTPMAQLNMLSQIYSVTVKNEAGNDLDKQWTRWSNSIPGNDNWLIREQWRWSGAGTTAPANPSTSSAIKTTEVTQYDVHANPLSTIDANNTLTTTKWGYNATVPIAQFVDATDPQTFFEDFGDGDYDGWTVIDNFSQGNTQWSIVNGTLRRTNPGSAIGEEHDRIQYDKGSETTGKVIAEFDLRIADSNNWDLTIGIGGNLWNGGHPGTEQAVFTALNNEAWYNHDPGGWSLIHSGFVIGRTYRLKIVADCATSKVDFYVDGLLVRQNASFKTSTTGIQKIAFGRYGYNSLSNEWYIDNVRIYPASSLARSASYDPATLRLSEMHDENGNLRAFGYDAFGRLTKEYTRINGLKRLAAEHRYLYSRTVGDVYSPSRPNTIETIRYESEDGFSDFSSSEGWTYSSGVTFNVPYAGETTVRMGAPAWRSISKPVGTGHRIARVDFYPDNTTGGTPHVLYFEGSGYRFAVQYIPTTKKFRIQTNFGSGYQYPFTFTLDAQPNRWYTVEIEKTETGEAYAFVFPKGQGRIHDTGYVYHTSGYPTNWNPNIQSASNNDFFYLANHYIGIPDRSTIFVDGIGRQIQGNRQLKTATIVTSATTYDDVGRVSRVYKPFEKDFTGLNRHRYDGSFAANSNFYYNTIGGEAATNGYPYSETEYFPDPLDRIKRQSAPGTAFRMGTGKELKMEYLANLTNDVPNYDADMLFKNRRKDEDNKIVDTFIDKFGNTVATTLDPGGLNLRTTFEYDLLGNMTKSTPPKGSSYATDYKYNTLRQLYEKASPDAGKTEYLYDKNGNIRLVKDANHRSTSQNNINLGGTSGHPYNTSGSFTLNLPGKLTIMTFRTVGSSFIRLRVKATNETLLYTQESPAGGGQKTETIIVPNGSYSYEVETFGSGVYGFSITSTTGYEFIYHKYDAHNRLIETGEYESGSIDSFTQPNADNVDFPSSGRILNKVFTYDTPSSDPVAAGQRNVKGKLSMAQSYRLGVLALTTYYSYDELGRVEWALHKGLGSHTKKIRYHYDLQGRVTKKEYTDQQSANYSLYSYYEYDQIGRLTKVSTNTVDNPATAVKEAEYNYYAANVTKDMKLGNNIQQVDYRYNTRDWLTRINDVNNIGSDRFALRLWYNDTHQQMSNTARFNGNIVTLQRRGHNGYMMDAALRHPASN
jgi:YD repeat-containing protein